MRWAYRLLFIVLVSATAPRSFAQTLTEYVMPPGAHGPQDIALGPDGNLWFTAAESQAIGRITPSGEVSAFPIPGPCFEWFCFLSYIAAGPDGAMWYSGGGSGFGRVTMDGVTEDFDPPHVGSIHGLTSNAGYLWFVAGYSSVVRMTSSGEFTVFPLPSYNSFPFSICSAEGGVWFTEQNANKIGRVSDDGVLMEFQLPRVRSYPRGIVAGPDGAIWFVENGNEVNALGRLDPSSLTLEEFAIPTAYARPQDVVVGADGRLWFTESAFSNIGSFDISTHEFREFRLSSNRAWPYGIAAGPDGRVWFCETGSNTIGAITTTWLVADFSSSPALPLAGQTVAFSDASPGEPTSWTWAFGDGELSYAQNPSHTFTSAGTFDVTLTVANALDQRSVTKSVTVSAVPVAPTIISFTANPSIVEPGETTTLSWSSTGATNAFIDQGVGSVPTSGSTTFTPITGVPYTLTVTGPGGTAQASVTITASVQPPEPDRWVLPGMVYNDAWQSDLTVFNPGSQPMTLSLAFLDSTNPVYDPSLLVWIPVTLPGGSSKSYANVLSSYFAAPKGLWGAILVRGDVAPAAPVFTTRTYGSSAVGGTIGLSVPPSSTAAGVRAQSSDAASRLIGLKENDSAYTNLGVVNLAADDVSVEVKFFDAPGNPLGVPVTFNLGPYGVFQLAHVLSADPPAGAGYKPPVDTFSASLRVVSGTAVAPYATVIDSVSRDPIVVTPQLLPVASYRMPGVVRVQGASGTIWRSDVALFNASSNSRSVKITFTYRSPGEAPVAVTTALALDPGESTEIEDFVKTQLQLAEADTGAYSNSWVDFEPEGTTNTDPLLVIGKTYNNQPTGNVGVQVPGFTTEDGASQTGTNKRLLLTGLSSSTAYRTNVAFFLVDPKAQAPQVSATVNVLDANGAILRQIPIALDSTTGFIQKNDNEIFADLPADQRSEMSVVVDAVTGNAAIAGYATLIDNTSGDGTFVQAVPAP